MTSYRRDLPVDGGWSSVFHLAMSRAVATGAAIGTTVFATQIFRDPRASHREANLALLAVFAGTTLWAIADAWRRSPGRGGARAFAGAGLVVALISPLVFPPAPPGMPPPLPGPIPYPAFLHIVPIAVFVTPFAWSPTAGIAASVALALVTFQQRAPSVGAAEGALEAFVSMGVGIFCVALYRLLLRTGARVVRDQRRAWLALGATTRQDARTQERERWDALVHDKVLGTLLLAARASAWSQESGGQALAADALDALAAPAAETGHDIPELVVAKARALGLELSNEIHVSADLPMATGPGAEALVTAATEALTNVARHAGVRHAQVGIRLTRAESLVSVRDAGVGFDAHHVPPNRAGLRKGIHAVMASVGGSAEVTSVPGQGTEVVLRLPPEATTPARARLDHTWLRPLLPWLIACILPLPVIGALNVDAVRSGWVLVGTLVVTLGLVAALWSARWVTRWSYAAAVAILALFTVSAANLAEPHPGWPWWIGGAQNAAVGVLAFRTKLAPTTVAAVGSLPALLMGTWLSGGSVAWVPVMEAWPQVLVWAVVGVALQRGLAWAGHALSASESARARAAVSQTRSRIREAEFARRTVALGGAVVPMLQRLGDPRDLTDTERRECLRLEAAARDELVAGPLMSRELREAVAAARERGVAVELSAVELSAVGLSAVELSAADAAPDPDAGEVEGAPSSDGTAGWVAGAKAFRAAVSAALGAAGAGSVVTARWRPRPGCRFGSITIVGPWTATPDFSAWLSGVDARAGVELESSYDEESVLVSLSCRTTLDAEPLELHA